MRVGNDEVLVRDAQPGDRNYILSTWLRSAKELSRMPKDLFFALTRPQAELDISGDTIVACSEESPGTILGWACYSGSVLRWAYVDFKLRGMGIFKLIRDSQIR